MAPRARSLVARTATFAVAGLVAACATPFKQAPQGPATSPVAPAEAEQHPERAAARGKLKPMPVRPLSITTNCRFKDEVGYSASAMLDISYSEVRAFAATVDVPKHGSCQFDLANFKQVPQDTHVELRAKDGCTVRVWEQGKQVTVAFSDCANWCTKGTFDYVWPILVDRPSGHCY